MSTNSTKTTILAKKGPLARVWLAAHWKNRITDKLSKSAINATDIQIAAAEIRDENFAPMALRLSGQLLLGVVTIYSKKTEYLLGDCNNILTKVKTVFRTGNVDMSTANVRSSHAQAQNLLLRDTIADMSELIDLPALDFDMTLDMSALSSTANVARQQDITMDSLEYPRHGGLSILDEEEDPLAGGVGDMILDIGQDELTYDGPSIELGRRAGSELLDDPELSLQDTNMTFDNVPQDDGKDISAAPEFILDDIPEFQPDEVILPTTPRANPEPLDPEATPLPEDGEQATPRPIKQAPRKRKIAEDVTTEIPSRTVSANLKDTSAIRKKQKFLSADPIMLNLQRKSLTGGFASDIFEPRNLNPAIRNLLAPELLRRMTAIRMKRKRDATVEADEVEQNATKERRIGDESTTNFETDPLPEFELPQMEFSTIREEDDSDLPALELENVGEGPSAREETTQYATLEPPQSDPIEAPQTQMESQTQVASINTKEAVQQIRDTLDASPTSNITFEGLAAGSTKAAASELFFQVLLLASKDAIKVTQTAPYEAIDITSRPSLATMNFDAPTQVTV